LAIDNLKFFVVSFSGGQVTNLNLFVSEKIQAQVAVNGDKQLQATVPHETLIGLLDLAGLPREHRLSRKRGNFLDITVTTPKGNEVTLRQGDTHAIWAVHQSSNEARMLLRFAAQKGAVSFPISSVNAVIATQQPVVTVEDMEDCPV